MSWIFFAGYIKIENDFLQSSFSILENQPMDMLLGLDMLKRHQVNIGFIARKSVFRVCHQVRRKLVFRDANHLDFCGIMPIFKANFRIRISDVKITANNNFKMVPDKITGVTSTTTPVIPEHW